MFATRRFRVAFASFLILSAQLLLLSLAFVGSVAADAKIADGALRALESKVVFRTLPNGVRVIVYRRSGAPVFAGAVTVRVGGTDEPQGQTGISHMLEHMAFKGTTQIGTKNWPRERVLLAELEKLAEQQGPDGGLPPAVQPRWDTVMAELKELWPSESFTREFDRRGASGMNAVTSSEFTQYFVSMPTNAFEFWCAMEAARILDPVMRQFYMERDVVMEERRMRYEDSPEGTLYERLIGISFLAHPYRNPVIGYPHDIRRLTASATDAFRRRYYVAQNIVVSLVGDLDPESAVATVNRYFGPVASGTVPDRPLMVEPEARGERTVTVVAEASPVVYIAFHKPTYPHPDQAAISVAAQMLSGGPLSPLYQTLVEKEQLSVDVSSDEVPGIVYPNLLAFGFTVRAPHTTTEVLNAFDRVLASVKSSPIDEELLAIAKRTMAVDLLSSLQSNLELARNLGTFESLFSRWNLLTDWYAELMAVSASDVKRVINQYLVVNNRVVARLESQAKG